MLVVVVVCRYLYCLLVSVVSCLSLFGTACLIIVVVIIVVIVFVTVIVTVVWDFFV